MIVVSTTTAMATFEALYSGIFSWFGNAAVYLIAFGLLWILFQFGVKQLALWKK